MQGTYVSTKKQHRTTSQKRRTTDLLVNDRKNIFENYYSNQAERGFAAWAVFVGRTVVFVHGKGKGA